MAKRYDRDIEKGFVTRSERVLRFARRAMAQKRVLIALLAVWGLYSALVFGRLAWIKTVHIASFTPHIKRNRRLPLAQEASRRYAQVVANVEDWSTRGLSRPWPEGLRSPYEFELDEIAAMLRHLMQENSFGCLAAVHVGVPVAVVQIGDKTIVNPLLIEHGQTQIVVQEEASARSKKNAPQHPHTHTHSLSTRSPPFTQATTCSANATKPSRSTACSTTKSCTTWSPSACNICWN